MTVASSRLLAALSIALAAAAATGCDAAEKGRARARAAAAAENERRTAEIGGPAEVKKPPVTDRQHVGCDVLINATAFGTALGEAEPVEVADVTAQDRDAAAVCAIKRGGIRPTAAEQEAKQKKEGHLGVLPGDPICNVYAYCWTLETPEAFEKRCRDSSETFDDSMGFPACVRTIQTGEHDVKTFRMYDADTKCLLKVGAGPSMVDNDVIAKCARAAVEHIGPDNIVPGGKPATPSEGDESSAPAAIKL